MIELQFIPWARFRARRMPKVTTSWLRRVRDEATSTFRAGMLGPHTGRIYYRRRGRHQASAPGEYPAKDTGRLLASLKGQSTPQEAVIGTNMPYSKYLREGTRKLDGTRLMMRRKMSDNALREGRAAAGHPKGWVAWARSKA